MPFRINWAALLASFAVPLGALGIAMISQAPARRVVPPAPPTTGESARESSHAYPGGALDTDCSHVADGLGGSGYQFIATCPGRAVAPDARWAVVQREGEGGGIILVSEGERLLDEIPALTDAMPFVLYWSPDSTWFFANHYQGSSMERLRVFEIVNRTVVERSAVYAAAIRTAVARYPCLGRGAAVYASGWRWSRDGRRIAMTVYARPDACHVETRPGVWEPAGRWEVLWMIGDAETGRIDPASVRVRQDGVGAMPADGPYASL